MCLITNVFDGSLGTARPFNLFTSQFNSLTRLIKKGSELIWLLALLDLFRPKFCLIFYIYLMHFSPILPTTRKFMTLGNIIWTTWDYRLTFLFNKKNSRCFMKWKLFLFNTKFQIENKNYSNFHLSDIYIYIYIYIIFYIF
jgi:hypothetical protein